MYCKNLGLNDDVGLSIGFSVALCLCVSRRRGVYRHVANGCVFGHESGYEFWNRRKSMKNDKICIKFETLNGRINEAAHFFTIFSKFARKINEIRFFFVKFEICQLFYKSYRILAVCL